MADRNETEWYVEMSVDWSHDRKSLFFRPLVPPKVDPVIMAGGDVEKGLAEIRLLPGKLTDDLATKLRALGAVPKREGMPSTRPTRRADKSLRFHREGLERVGVPKEEVDAWLEDTADTVTE